MESFNLDSHLQPIYSRYPEATRRPLIGITANYADGNASLADRYYKQVVRAGGVPVLMPPVSDESVIINTLDRIDGLLLSGGGDFNPLWDGEEPMPQLHSINRERDLAELLTVRLAFNRQLPILGICRGIQTLTLALGGHVRQDIDATEEDPTIARVKHSQDADRQEPTHSVSISDGSLLAAIYPRNEYGGKIFVNSFHHQAVLTPGGHLRVSARSTDDVVEAVESTEHKPILAVQWHPEWLDDEGLCLFSWLVGEAKLFNKAKLFHQRHITFDSHCDTPMFFPQGINFAHRDPRILYDLHKMTDGRTDAVTMVAYLPQHPKPGEIPEGMSPKQYADSIFDKLGDIISENHDYIAQARTPNDVIANKRRGLKSIVFGIENGLALEGDTANVPHFKQRGVSYITLCHNGDNDLCDSARGTATHGGVSPLGEQVIREMNRQGVMVDLSHAAESSFYDALEISRTPIVCSHSNSKALCDVPRNLTDDQMRALAKCGGVCQITLYHGFLRKEGEASVVDALRHLDHAISIMGIDHVGLGTDFDGDGGVCGLADASELINLTRHLLRRRYSEADIAKIWGLNWLRVMRTVQQSAQEQ